MEFKFIDTNLNAQYKNLRDLRHFNQREITTRDEYFAWVKEWKTLHKELVETIIWLRSEKNKSKYGGSSDRFYRMNCLHSMKMYLRHYAHMMYRARTDNKAKLIAGAYRELEAA